MTINVDILPVQDEEEALLLMLHHLHLAASYFEATPAPVRESMVPDTYAAPAIWSFIKTMDNLYPED